MRGIVSLMAKGMQAADEATRSRVARSGGEGRAAAMTAGERAASAGAAGAAGHRPAALARRIVKAWSDLSDADRAEVIGILTTGLPLARRRGA